MNSDLEQALIVAARRVAEELQYDPHFADTQAREIAETRLFLARMNALNAYYQSLAGFKLNPEGELIPIYSYERETRDGDLAFVERFRTAYPRSIPAMPEPVPMILWCPKCAVQHIDATEPHATTCPGYVKNSIQLTQLGLECDCSRWTNPPHRSHLCAYCGHVWRPADVPTTGVKEILTVGEKDDPEPVRGVLDKLARFRPTLPRWLHKERQSVYIEIARGLFQNSTGGRYFDNCNVVIYRGEDGRHWVRLQSEFDDGRFEPAT